MPSRSAVASAENTLDGHSSGEIAAQEQLGLGVRSARVESMVELARYVSGPLNKEPQGNAAAKQPVNTRDMGAEVAAHQNGASAVGESRAQPLVAANVESVERGFI